MSDKEKNALGLQRKSLYVAADSLRTSLNSNQISVSGYINKRRHKNKMQATALEVQEAVQTKQIEALGGAKVIEAQAVGSLMKAQIIAGTTEAMAENKEGIAKTFNKTTQAQSEIAKDAMKGAFKASNDFKSSLDLLGEEEGFDANQIALMKESSDALAQADTMSGFDIMNIMKESDKIAYSRISENSIFDPDNGEEDDFFKF